MQESQRSTRSALVHALLVLAQQLVELDENGGASTAPRKVSSKSTRPQRKPRGPAKTGTKTAGRKPAVEKGRPGRKIDPETSAAVERIAGVMSANGGNGAPRTLKELRTEAGVTTRILQRAVAWMKRHKRIRAVRPGCYALTKAARS